MRCIVVKGKTISAINNIINLNVIIIRLVLY